MQIWFLFPYATEDAGAIFCIGPIEKFGTWNCSWNSANDDFSRQSMLFQMMAEEDVPIFRRVAISGSKVSSFLKSKTGRSLNRNG